MQNVFPTNDIIEFEEIYGYKRESAQPQKNPKTFEFKNPHIDNCKYTKGVTYKWFKSTEVSEYEKRNFVEVPESYLNIRNVILQIYESNCKYIHLSDIYIKMDKCNLMDIYKIYTFLDKLNLINRRDKLGEAMDLLQNIDLFKIITDKTQNEIKEVEQNSNDTSQTLRNRIKSVKDDILLSKCSCGSSANAYTKQGDCICNDCLKCGRYLNKFTSSDFIEIDRDVTKRKWTKRDEIRLLEAIDKYSDDWENVSRYVGNKDKNDCIFHFMTMPIFESNLNVGYDTHMPFMLTTNPITHIISFLCSVVHPSCAASVAKLVLKGVSTPDQNLMKKMLLEAKRKCEEIYLLEDKKIKRLHNVLKESFFLLIDLKAKNYILMHNRFNKMREDLIMALKTEFSD